MQIFSAEAGQHQHQLLGGGVGRGGSALILWAGLAILCNMCATKANKKATVRGFVNSGSRHGRSHVTRGQSRSHAYLFLLLPHGCVILILPDIRCDCNYFHLLKSFLNYVKNSPRYDRVAVHVLRKCVE